MVLGDLGDGGEVGVGGRDMVLIDFSFLGLSLCERNVRNRLIMSGMDARDSYE